MKTDGFVRRIKGKTAIVSTCRPESCVGCANAGICNKKEVEILAVNYAGAKAGDSVTIETEKDTYSLAMICYIFLVPVAILFAGYFLYTMNAWLLFICIPLIAAYILILRHFERTYRPTAVITEVKSSSEN